MEEEIQTALDGVINKEIEIILSSEEGKEHSEAINNLATIYKLRTEELKMNLDYEEKLHSRVLEEERQIREDKLKIEGSKDKYLGYGIDIVAIVLPLVFYASWMKKGFEFEEKGTFTSTTFRGLFSRFKTTK